MTLGFPTIVIPAINGGDGRTVDQSFSKLTDEQISWISTCACLSYDKPHTYIFTITISVRFNFRFNKLIMRAFGMLLIRCTNRTYW